MPRGLGLLGGLVAITVGALRTFCREVASPDSSGATAEREFMVWINAALRRLYSETSWDRTITERKITLEPAVEGDDLTVVQGSRTIATVVTVLLDRYVAERWELRVDSEERFCMELASLTSANEAEVREGDEWVKASASGLSFKLVRVRYELREAREVARVQNLTHRTEVQVLTAKDFDNIRSMHSSSTAGQPRYATLRAGHLELWPLQPDDYLKIGVTYRRSFTTIPTGEGDDTEVEWDEQEQDLLEAAIRLEASITQGENSPVPYKLAWAEYTSRVEKVKATSQKNTELGPLNVSVPSKIRRGVDVAVPNWIGRIEP